MIVIAGCCCFGLISSGTVVWNYR